MTRFKYGQFLDDEDDDDDEEDYRSSARVTPGGRWLSAEPQKNHFVIEYLIKLIIMTMKKKKKKNLVVLIINDPSSSHLLSCDRTRNWSPLLLTWLFISSRQET